MVRPSSCPNIKWRRRSWHISVRIEIKDILQGMALAKPSFSAHGIKSCWIPAAQTPALRYHSVSFFNRVSQAGIKTKNDEKLSCQIIIVHREEVDFSTLPTNLFDKNSTADPLVISWSELVSLFCLCLRASPSHMGPPPKTGKQTGSSS